MRTERSRTLEAQSTEVDSASGASMSSAGIKEAVEDALSKAGGAEAVEETGTEAAETEAVEVETEAAETEAAETEAAEVETEAAETEAEAAEPEEAGESAYADGVYEGTGSGNGGDMNVEVTVENGKITDRSSKHSRPRLIPQAAPACPAQELRKRLRMP